MVTKKCTNVTKLIKCAFAKLNTKTCSTKPQSIQSKIIFVIDFIVTMFGSSNKK